VATVPDLPSEYNGESGSLGRMETGWIKRITAPPAAYQPAYDNAATDVVGIACDGMGMQLEVLDCSQHPHILGVLYPAARQLYLDWTILHDAPKGIATHSTFVWRKAVDGSSLARFLVAWGAAHMTTVVEPRPVIYGFSRPNETPTIATMQHRMATMRRVAQLLCPRPRLYGQVKELVSYYPNHRTQDDGWLIPALAEMNRCPPSVVRLSLVEFVSASWYSFSAGLLEDLPLLRMRQRGLVSWGVPLPVSNFPRYTTQSPRELPQLSL
jgi:hypothetical protein